MEPNLSLCQNLNQNVVWPTTTSLSQSVGFSTESLCSNLARQLQSQNHQYYAYNNQQQQQEVNNFIDPQHHSLRRSNSEGHIMSNKRLPLTELSINHIIEPLERLDSHVDYIFQGYWLKSGDERTSRLPLMVGGPWKLLCATAIYLYLIKWLLPRLMARRSTPLELQWLIRAYNLFMVCANMYAFYHGLRILDYGRKCFGCNKQNSVDSRDKSPEAWELLHYGWLFMLSRLVEWVDTIFFVLRKRQRQVTKLHVFHHSFVPLLSWFYLKFYPDVTMAFFPLVNTLVHTVMYAYYLLATFGPKLQPYLWWKKYLTSMQITQFVAILIQLASIPLSGDPACQYPRSFLLGAISGASLFLFLFYTYYKETYRRPSNNSKTDIMTKVNEEGRLMDKLSNDKNSNDTCRRARPTRDGCSRALSELIDDSILPMTQGSNDHVSNVPYKKMK